MVAWVHSLFLAHILRRLMIWTEWGKASGERKLGAYIKDTVDYIIYLINMLHLFSAVHNKRLKEYLLGYQLSLSLMYFFFLMFLMAPKWSWQERNTNTKLFTRSSSWGCVWASLPFLGKKLDFQSSKLHCAPVNFNNKVQKKVIYGLYHDEHRHLKVAEQKCNRRVQQSLLIKGLHATFSYGKSLAHQWWFPTQQPVLWDTNPPAGRTQSNE